ncbi:hypothetical protein GY21_02780 [Cryobacterium roopkundense]|uniref:Uncharacterized protein n=1 Tax=Cryobacterium roopkundense TaxID=1001240 RepID=A0A099JQD7_9MICO|nr:hypothetical protein [Cryobacterium roopkundense]KGJ80396.1 hypothetical protein GY21_02780 [Cryobacterium roopkundense]MBB5642038.1 hypothetical protein [Cryobacterium roopkundense]
MSDNYPELSGYEPHDSKRPLRSRHLTRLMRIVVVLGLLALVVPGVLTTMRVASTTAANACIVDVARYYPFASSSDARFEFTGPGGLGWQCYAIDRNERETFVTPLGLIPSAPQSGSPGRAI